MSRKDSIETVHRYYAALNNPDQSVMFGLLTPDIQFRMAGNTPFSGTYNGAESVKNLFDAVFEKFVVETCNFGRTYRIVCADDDGAVAIMYGSGTTKLGRQYKQTYLHVFKIRDGQIYRFYDFYDTVMIESVIFGNDLKNPEKETSSPLDCLDEPVI